MGMTVTQNPQEATVRYAKICLVAIAAVLIGVSETVQAQEEEMAAPAEAIAPDQVETILAGWKSKPAEVARTMITKYGQPQEATANVLIWRNNGPWKRTVLINEEIPHEFPIPHVDVLEQVIDYRVDPEKFDELAEYDGSVIVERTRGEISARCDKEEANFLALNLANDIVTGEKDVAEARAFYAEAVIEKKHPEYMQGLVFEVPSGETGDTDEAVAQESANP